MKISLARWEFDGSSSGWWMVRELPGVALVYVDTGRGCEWEVYSRPGLFGDYPGDAWVEAQAVWGKGFELTDLSCLPHKRFATRAQAVLALEAAFGDVPRPALCEVIG